MVALLIAVVNTGRLHFSTLMACLRLAIAVVTLTLASPGLAAPGKGPKHAKQTVALAPAQADGNVSKSALEGIDRVLASHAGASSEVVGTKVLDKRVKPDFSSAVRACKREGPCLSRLSRTLHVDNVLVPVAKPEKSGTSLSVTVAGDAGVHKVSFLFVTLADLNAAVANNALALFGEAEEGSDTPTEPIAALPLEPPPLEEVKPADAKPADTKPAPQPEVALTPLTQPGLPDAPPLDDSIVVRREQSSVTWKTYIGVPAAVLGAVGVTYGILQYSHHRHLVDDANNNPNLTQREAKAIDDDAQSAYNRSRVGIFVGTPLLVAGAALLTWDLFIADNRSAMAEKRMHWAVGPTVGGAAGSLLLRF